MSAEEFVKYLNWGSPVAAMWGASQVLERNLFLGIVLIVYVVVWVMANTAAMLVLLIRRMRDLKATYRGGASTSKDEV